MKTPCTMRSTVKVAEAGRHRQQRRWYRQQREADKDALPAVDRAGEQRDGEAGHRHAHGAGIDREAHRGRASPDNGAPARAGWPGWRTGRPPSETPLARSPVPVPTRQMSGGSRPSPASAASLRQSMCWPWCLSFWARKGSQTPHGVFAAFGWRSGEGRPLVQRLESPSMVGSSSDTVGWMCMARCITRVGRLGVHEVEYGSG